MASLADRRASAEKHMGEGKPVPVNRAWRRGAAGALVLVLSQLGLGGAVGAPAAAAAACAGGVDSDFNGDGIRDVAIADPLATVSGQEEAGAIQIVYGGGAGVTTLSQDTPNVSDAAEAGDRFGFSMAVYDANLDGCSDIAVGMPYEDVGTVKDAGLVHLVYGSTAGIGQGASSLGFRQGSDGKLANDYEVDDWVGYSVAGGISTTGVPFLVIGIPGEDSSGLTDMGFAAYAYGVSPSVATVHQNSVGIWEEAEAYDRFGSSVAATDRYFTVGVPGESIGTVGFAGGLHVFRPSLNTDGIPDQYFGMRQDVTLSGDVGEADDQYGTALALAPYRPSGAATITDAILAVGVPGEDIGTNADAGMVHVYHVKSDGTVVQLNRIDQNVDGVDGDAEAGDYFGQRLAAVNTSVNVVSTAITMRLAVGVPGEESTTDAPEAGGVQLFSLLGAPGGADSWIEPGAGIPSGPSARTYAGISVSASTSLLYVGVPYGPAAGRALYGFPWNAASGSAPTQTWKPGEGGIPAAGAAAFGATAR
ncbi:VCBS repeat-containing protein [Streptomyces sp. NPDC050263]|uniref:VCBS repeat-containing protein n=1 Tax=Streptomyces sp. NPDC050263 TaxID=3155037 RepID=UPI0034477896